MLNHKEILKGLDLDKQIAEAKKHLSPKDSAFFSDTYKELMKGIKGGNIDIQSQIEKIKSYANNK